MHVHKVLRLGWGTEAAQSEVSYSQTMGKVEHEVERQV